mgnify:CR=1 FL=1
MTTTQYTPEVRAKLERYLATYELPEGLGDEYGACSIAAINLALSGELTDDIPACMSAVLGAATINLQDAMPHEMRNSKRYKDWLPTAAGTGRDHEEERLSILMDWTWGTVLPRLQGEADEHGVGTVWRRMCEERSYNAAVDAYEAAQDAGAGFLADCANYISCAALDEDTFYSVAAGYAAHTTACAVDADHAFWEAVDPIGVLERMTNLKGSDQ